MAFQMDSVAKEIYFIYAAIPIQNGCGLLMVYFRLDGMKEKRNMIKSEREIVIIKKKKDFVFEFWHLVVGRRSSKRKQEIIEINCGKMIQAKKKLNKNGRGFFFQPEMSEFRVSFQCEIS